MENFLIPLPPFFVNLVPYNLKACLGGSLYKLNNFIHLKGHVMNLVT